MELYLQPTFFIDSDHPEVVWKANELVDDLMTPTEQAKAFFYYVRDEYLYDPFNIDFTPKLLKASHILTREDDKVGRGYCTEKAVLFAALCRVKKIPSRLVFCNVRNHIGTSKLTEVLRTDLMVFHGYNETYLNGRWVKSTVAFNKSLCDRLGVNTLEFDGVKDQIFQEFDRNGGTFMVYEHDYGSFHDVPHDMFVRELKRYYPHVFENRTEFTSNFV